MSVLQRVAHRVAGQVRSASTLTLPKDSNQALGLGEYARDFINGKYGDDVDDVVYDKVQMFHTDSVMCGLSALALKTNAPNVLRAEALMYPDPKGQSIILVTARIYIFL